LSRKLGIAGLQLKKDFINQEYNLENFERVARLNKARFPWIDLIFTGEFYLQRYGSPDWKNFADHIPNDQTDRLSELAKELNCWLVPGSFLEKESEKIFNTALVFDTNGEIIAKYQKVFPWMPHEDTAWGTEFVTFDIQDIGRIGVVICYDLWFPEIFRTLAWMGAEVILQPSMTCTSDRPAELILAQANAIMFQCYFLNVNTLCFQGGGESIFVDPEGRTLQVVNTNEAVITEVVDFDKVSWIRQNGSFGMNPLWKSFRDSPLQGKFPPYENLLNGEIFKQLGELKLHKNVRSWKF
ncbi:MAG: carbon-nitrogen hydrolase family protein, partial [Candidatus Heimdallarchaeota archaeon]